MIKIVRNLYGLPRFAWVVMLGLAFFLSAPPSTTVAQSTAPTVQETTFAAPFLNQGAQPNAQTFQNNLSPDGIVNSIQTSSQNWIGVLSGMATRLFFLLVIIDFAWMVAQWLLQGRENTGEFLGQWIVKLIGINVVFWLVLIHGWELSQIIINSILSAGTNLPGLTGNVVRQQNFLGIAATGIGIATPMLVQAVIYALIPNVAIVGWTNLQLPLLWTELFGATAVIGAYVLMAGSILLAWIEMYIVTSIGVLMLGFSGSRWTQGFGWEKFLQLSFSIGIKMLMTYVCVDIALAIGPTIIAPAMVPGIGAIYAGFIASIMSLIVYNIPAFASSLMTGASNSAAGGAMQFAQSSASQLAGAMQSMVQSMERVASALEDKSAESVSNATSSSTDRHEVVQQFGLVPGQSGMETREAIATSLAQERELEGAAMNYAPLGMGNQAGAPTGWTDTAANWIAGSNGSSGLAGGDGRDGRDGMSTAPPAAISEIIDRERDRVNDGAAFANLGNGEGAMVAPNGTVMLPDASLVSPSGTYRTENGDYVMSDGKVVYEDGTTVMPSGVIFSADGVPVDDSALAGRETPQTMRAEAAEARDLADYARYEANMMHVRGAEASTENPPQATAAQMEMLQRIEDGRPLTSPSVYEPSREEIAQMAEMQRESGIGVSAAAMTGNGPQRELEYVSNGNSNPAGEPASFGQAARPVEQLGEATRQPEYVSNGRERVEEAAYRPLEAAASEPMTARNGAASLGNELREAQTPMFASASSPTREPEVLATQSPATFGNGSERVEETAYRPLEAAASAGAFESGFNGTRQPEPMTAGNGAASLGNELREVQAPVSASASSPTREPEVMPAQNGSLSAAGSDRVEEAVYRPLESGASGGTFESGAAASFNGRSRESEMAQAVSQSAQPARELEPVAASTASASASGSERVEEAAYRPLESGTSGGTFESTVGDRRRPEPMVAGEDASASFGDGVRAARELEPVAAPSFAANVSSERVEEPAYRPLESGTSGGTFESGLSETRKTEPMTPASGATASLANGSRESEVPQAAQPSRDPELAFTPSPIESGVSGGTFEEGPRDSEIPAASLIASKAPQPAAARESEIQREDRFEAAYTTKPEEPPTTPTDALPPSSEPPQRQGLFGRIVGSVFGRQDAEPAGTREASDKRDAEYSGNDSTAQGTMLPPTPFQGPADVDQRRTMFDEDRERKRDDDGKRGQP